MNEPVTRKAMPILQRMNIGAKFVNKRWILNSHALFSR